MKIIEKKILSIEEREIVFKLWNNEYPERLNYNTIAEFDLYLNGLSNTKHYLLINDTSRIQGWAFTFLRDGLDWFATLVNTEIQYKGNGSLLLAELKKDKKCLNGWVVDHENDMKQNGERYKSPLSFYSKNGFSICHDTRLENKKISAVKINWKINNTYLRA